MASTIHRVSGWTLLIALLGASGVRADDGDIVLGMSAIDAMRLFDIVWAMTNGGPAHASEVLATQMYDVAFGRFEMGRASATPVYLLLIAGVVIIALIAVIIDMALRLIERRALVWRDPS